MSTLSSSSKAEPGRWISTRNAFVAFVGSGAEAERGGGRRPKAASVHGSPGLFWALRAPDSAPLWLWSPDGRYRKPEPGHELQGSSL